MPICLCSDGATVSARTANCINFPNFTPTLGTKISVKFTNGYSPSSNTQLYLKFNSAGSSLPCTASGVAMMKGSIHAGAEIEFTLKGSSLSSQSDWHWDCASNIVEVTSDYIKYADGRNVHTSTYTVNLGNLTWYTSQYGLRYSSAFSGLVAKKIYTVNITGFTVLSDLVHPILTNDSKQIRFTTMIGNIDTAATVDLIVEYEM